MTLGWRHIPNFIEMFPQAKVIHMYRDLRAVVSSFSRTSNMPDNLYLNSIFNWIDSINCLNSYKKRLSKKQYYILKFEDIHENPDGISKSLCKFLGINHEQIMLQPEQWSNSYDRNFVSTNISAYTKEKVVGFDFNRTKQWKKSIRIDDLHLVEFLAGDKLA